ncbi:MAG: hypothetical protein Q8K70_10205 [Bacteroidota bacterium]|nr:hypothetical protein [Bacteroidota bacterium]
MKFFLSLFVFSMLFSSCINQNKADYEVKAELQLIDTLNGQLDEIKSWLDKISLEEINERYDIITHNYEYCDMRYRDLGLVVDEETARLMDEYKGYGKLYHRASDSFKPLVMEMEELYVQLKTLKASAYTKDYKKELFLAYFEREKKAVQDIYEYANNIIKPIIDTDLMYERSQKRVEELAESLKAE